MDPATLRDLVVDREATKARLEYCIDLELVVVLSFLRR